MIPLAFNLRKDIYPDGVVSNNIRVIVPNGGGDLADDWLNATSGLAADWNVANSGTGTDITDIVTSIVTGSGFSGNAQEMLINKTSSGFAEYTLASDDIYDNYEIGESIRISFYYRANTAFRLYMNTSLVADIALNTGNAILYTIDYQIPFVLSKFPNFRIRKNPVIANDYIQIDTVNIKRLPVIAEYPFDGNVTDDSGNSRTLDILNNVAYTDGRYGTANGALLGERTNTRYAAKADSWDTILGNTYSISCWVKFDNITDTSYVWSFASNTLTTVDNQLWLLQIGSELRFYQRDNALNLAQVSVPSAIQANVWYHIICTRDGNTMYLYLNNKLIGTADSTSVGATTLELLTMFTLYNDATNTYTTANILNGVVDDMKIIGRDLTIAERKSEFKEYPK